jgi:hypothetical protein
MISPFSIMHSNYTYRNNLKWDSKPGHVCGCLGLFFINILAKTNKFVLGSILLLCLVPSYRNHTLGDPKSEHFRVLTIPKFLYVLI